MVLGFISLILTFGQSYISSICIPEKLADTMLFCPKRGQYSHRKGPKKQPASDDDDAGHRRLLFYHHRFLAGGAKTAGCKPVSASFIFSFLIKIMQILDDPFGD